jgi:hypothetical protein
LSELASWCVASPICVDAVFSSDREGVPLLTLVVALWIEAFQVLSAEQTPSAQATVDEVAPAPEAAVVVGLPLPPPPPQAEAVSASAVTAAAASARNAVLLVI